MGAASLPMIVGRLVKAGSLVYICDELLWGAILGIAYAKLTGLFTWSWTWLFSPVIVLSVLELLSKVNMRRWNSSLDEFSTALTMLPAGYFLPWYVSVAASFVVTCIGIWQLGLPVRIVAKTLLTVATILKLDEVGAESLGRLWFAAVALDTGVYLVGSLGNFTMHASNGEPRSLLLMEFAPLGWRLVLFFIALDVQGFWPVPWQIIACLIAATYSLFVPALCSSRDPSPIAVIVVQCVRDLRWATYALVFALHTERLVDQRTAFYWCLAPSACLVAGICCVLALSAGKKDVPATGCSEAQSAC
eukprot:TRINITY_DN5910_c0_g2_i1.p1 TRINITY_DN5910_c0_g2~~TRINITY_DN5910_c0_g2_i1.p1  ORF type:complete len:326 (+),score=51.47 TRINITY_DN5910_c0_g2_i1:68-979(+)